MLALLLLFACSGPDDAGGPLPEPWARVGIARDDNLIGYLTDADGGTGTVELTASNRVLRGVVDLGEVDESLSVYIEGVAGGEGLELGATCKPKHLAEQSTGGCDYFQAGGGRIVDEWGTEIYEARTWDLGDGELVVDGIQTTASTVYLSFVFWQELDKEFVSARLSGEVIDAALLRPEPPPDTE